MSSRARRSTGNLNPATIHLLPISRLKEELQTRGIDISGSKEELAYRLEEHLQLVGGAYKPFDPSPIIDEQNDSNKRGRGKKRKLAIVTAFENHEDNAERENIEESHQLVKQKPIKFTWATEKPTAEHVPIIKLSAENEQLNSGLKITENKESTPVAEEKTPKKKIHEQKPKGETTTLEEITKVLVGITTENRSDLGQSSIIDEENQKALKEAKRKRNEEKRRQKEEKEKRQKELEDEIKAKKLIAPISSHIGNKPKEEVMKWKNNKNVVANFPNKFGEQRQENKIIKAKEKVGTLEKRRITLAGGEERKLTKQQGINASPSISSTPIISKTKPPQQINTTISRLDILDSILDEQEQLLARKKAQKAAEGGGTGDDIDFELELRRREKGRFPGFTTQQTSQQQQKKVNSNLVYAKVKSTISPILPMDTSELKLQSSPPPPANMAENQQQFSPQSSSTFPIPLIVDTRDPLGLSSVGPDTPPPLPPPPPSARPIKIQPTHPSFPISLILPPPPPPPPRKALIQQKAQNRHEEIQPSQTNESIVNVVTDVISNLTSNVSQLLLNEKERYDTCSEICQDTEIDGSHYTHSREILAHEYQGIDKVDLMEKQTNELIRSTSELDVDIDDEESTISDYDDIDDEEFDDEEDEEEIAEGISSVENGNNEQETPAELQHLLKDPKALLHKASDVLRKKFGAETSELEPHAHYEQVALSIEEMQEEEDEEYRQLPDPDQFHGEPIPDDMDDDLFEIAAGLPLRDKKRDKEPQPIEEEPLPNDEQIELDFYNSDLNMKSATNNKWLIEPDNADGFALMYSCVRSNYGLIVPEQRDDMPPVAFQVKITELLSLKHLPFEEPDAHDIRIGWSRAGTSLMLGEFPNSFAFNSMANKATGNIFTDYGEPFGLDDVITTVLDINCGEIRYFKNGQPLGPAFTDIQFQTGDVYFPHIATKNCKLFVNFGNEIPETVQPKPKSSTMSSNEESSKNDEENNLHWSMPLDEIPEGTKWIGAMNVRQMSPSKRPISDKAHCTIIAMVGLSGVGKTTWVRQYLKEHPEENWFLLNTDTILQAMTVNGIPRQRVHQGRWDMVMGLTAKSLSRSLQMACRRRHNYILDQTNVTREARKKKLTQFQDFQRKCVVIIPSEAEHERRLIRQAREQGGMGQMPAEAMLEMKGNFSIPSTELEPIEDVIFIEPPIERINEAIEQVRRYNEEGQPWVRQQQRYGRNRGPPPPVISDHSNLPFVGTTRICV